MNGHPALAPEFELAAVTSGRMITRRTCAGRPLVLFFHDQDGIKVIQALQVAVRTQWPRAEQLLIGSVVNMQLIPPFLRGVSEKMMGLAFREAARQLPPGLDPTDYILILPDKTGRVSHALGVFDGGKDPCALVIDGQWRLCARVSGPELPAQIVAALEPLLSARRD